MYPLSSPGTPPTTPKDFLSSNSENSSSLTSSIPSDFFNLSQEKSAYSHDNPKDLRRLVSIQNNAFVSRNFAREFVDFIYARQLASTPIKIEIIQDIEALLVPPLSGASLYYLKHSAEYIQKKVIDFILQATPEESFLIKDAFVLNSPLEMVDLHTLFDDLGSSNAPKTAEEFFSKFVDIFELSPPPFPLKPQQKEYIDRIRQTLSDHSDSRLIQLQQHLIEFMNLCTSRERNGMRDVLLPQLPSNLYFLEIFVSKKLPLDKFEQFGKAPVSLCYAILGRSPASNELLNRAAVSMHRAGRFMDCIELSRPPYTEEYRLSVINVRIEKGNLTP